MLDIGSKSKNTFGAMFAKRRKEGREEGIWMEKRKRLSLNGHRFLPKKSGQMSFV